MDFFHSCHPRHSRWVPLVALVLLCCTMVHATPPPTQGEKQSRQLLADDDDDPFDIILISTVSVLAFAYLIYIIHQRLTGANNYAVAGSQDSKREPLLEGSSEFYFASDRQRISEVSGDRVRISACGVTEYRHSVNGTVTASL
jgi:hypothetical protein